MDQDVVKVDQTFLSGNVSQHPLSHSNVAGALHRPKQRTLNCHNTLPVQNTVFGMASGLRGTCQYLLRRFKEEYQDEPDTKSKDPSMQGSGYESFLVTLCSSL